MGWGLYFQVVGTPNYYMWSSKFFLPQVVETLIPSITFISLPLLPACSPCSPCSQLAPSHPQLAPLAPLTPYPHRGGGDPKTEYNIPLAPPHSQLAPSSLPLLPACSLSPPACSPSSPLSLAPTKVVGTLKHSITYPSLLPSPRACSQFTPLAPSLLPGSEPPGETFTTSYFLIVVKLCDMILWP